MSAGGRVEGLPPRRRAVGRSQADEMTHELQRGSGGVNPERTAYERRHVPAHGIRNEQVKPYVAARDASSRAKASAFTPKRSRCRIGCRVVKAPPPAAGASEEFLAARSNARLRPTDRGNARRATCSRLRRTRRQVRAHHTRRRSSGRSSDEERARAEGNCPRSAAGL